MVFARHKPFVNHLELKLPNGPPDLFTCESDYVDSFSDVFGPAPIEASIGNLVVATSSSGKVCNDYPSVIHIRSHSLHSSGAYIDPSSVRSKLTLHETGDELELLAEKEYREAKEELEEYSVNDDAVKENNLESNDCCMNYQSIGVEDFEVLKVVGQGAFGKVYQVRRTGTSEIYAMKVMRKDKIVQKNHAEYIKSERDILTKVVHPFIVRLRYAFQTKYRLYLVLDFVNGGHVFFHLYRQGLFREDLARFYAGEIVCAVSHLHANGIMHRDLKPENILLDADGHLVLTDFGLAKEFTEIARSNSMCGTLEYIAPEIFIGKGHDKAADWWSVGILLFEMLTGKPPFTGGNRQKIQQKIIKDKLKLPAFLSSEAHSLLKGLLQKDARKRLGSGARGSEEIKSHKWFKSVNWKKLEAREIRPSFVPEVSGKHCVANFEERWTNMPLLDSPAASPKKDDNTFKKFSFIGTPSLCLVGDA
ncbi:serine/threonine-protein kinase AtPK2/AtPK19 [Arachis duranensis]|uniref:non-specific serine/threonine protein kinase n=1 Tax=Arachis duranensis TaxID=130453 RepID=A0A6P4B306_ARADU|nr:serine/threonine-protein kinase AtPK2/AtPK19 [Arachis duranensis]XP_015933081.1 serine/threonine-protein kinase AtPK2/AtPK19 [Arachis duranensis]XP_015933082.1 serine/threonine-protein kinase AtPK2/AtPK19 [Arachis duranensis]XP_020983781.1 serine/threonine-protein kinase AtPK2/AtPK19 [Arachis duranensis]